MCIYVQNHCISTSYLPYIGIFTVSQYICRISVVYSLRLCIELYFTSLYIHRISVYLPQLCIFTTSLYIYHSSVYSPHLCIFTTSLYNYFIKYVHHSSVYSQYLCIFTTALYIHHISVYPPHLCIITL